MGVRTRFAPSPTGLLHVGRVRTALYAYLYAKANQGKCVLRIEDTDEARSTQAAVDVIIQGLAWLGLDWDEGPIFQRSRYARYQAVADQLLAQGHAYRCYCTKERLETLRETQIKAQQTPKYDGHCRHRQDAIDSPYVLRFKMPEKGVTAFHDLVYGDIQVDNTVLDDLVILRGDRSPTYNFAVVVDDWDMEITHVIRGDDHINNTPKQICIFNALGVTLPVFAHLPMILGADGKKLSKRHGAVSVLEFQEQGYLKEAVLNYMVRLGWSHGDQEIFSMEDMIQYFDLAHVQKSSARFDYEKLRWLNQHYQKTLPPTQVAQALIPLFEERDIDIHRGPALEKVVEVQASRVKTLQDIVDESVFWYQPKVVFHDPCPPCPADMQPVFHILHDRLEGITAWEAGVIHDVLKAIVAEQGVSFGAVAQPLRIILTGRKNTPSLDITMALLGKARCLERLRTWLEV